MKGRNFITPSVISNEEQHGIEIELSNGSGIFDENRLWAITVMINGKTNDELSGLRDSEDKARKDYREIKTKLFEQ